MHPDQFTKEVEAPSDFTPGGKTYSEAQLHWYMEEYLKQQTDYPLKKFVLDLKRIVDRGNTEANSFNNGEKARFNSVIYMRNIARKILNNVEVVKVKG